MQGELMLQPPRVRGRELADACAAKAEATTPFDTAGAQAYILGLLDKYTEASGEDLTDAAIHLGGFKPHDARAYGAVFAGLSRKGLIVCAGYCERRKGNSTAGGRKWRRTGKQP